MATHKKNIADLIDRDMEGRDFSETVGGRRDPPTLPVAGEQTSPKGKSRRVNVVMDDGDFKKLQDLARGQGTTASALIRQMIKKAIKA